MKKLDFKGILLLLFSLAPFTLSGMNQPVIKQADADQQVTKQVVRGKVSVQATGKMFYVPSCFHERYLGHKYQDISIPLVPVSVEIDSNDKDIFKTQNQFIKSPEYLLLSTFYKKGDTGEFLNTQKNEVVTCEYRNFTLELTVQSPLSDDMIDRFIDKVRLAPRSLLENYCDGKKSEYFGQMDELRKSGVIDDDWDHDKKSYLYTVGLLKDCASEQSSEDADSDTSEQSSESPSSNDDESSGEDLPVIWPHRRYEAVDVHTGREICFFEIIYPNNSQGKWFGGIAYQLFNFVDLTNNICTVLHPDGSLLRCWMSCAFLKSITILLVRDAKKSAPAANYEKVTAEYKTIIDEYHLLTIHLVDDACPYVDKDGRLFIRVRLDSPEDDITSTYTSLQYDKIRIEDGICIVDDSDDGYMEFKVDEEFRKKLDVAKNKQPIRMPTIQLRQQNPIQYSQEGEIMVTVIENPEIPNKSTFEREISYGSLIFPDKNDDVCYVSFKPNETTEKLKVCGGVKGFQKDLKTRVSEFEKSTPKPKLTNDNSSNTTSLNNSKNSDKDSDEGTSSYVSKDSDNDSGEDVSSNDSKDSGKSSYLSTRTQYIIAAGVLLTGFCGGIYLMYTKSPQFGQGFMRYVLGYVMPASGLFSRVLTSR